MKRIAIAWLALVVITGVGIGLALGIGYYLAPQSRLAKADAIVAISGGSTDARTAEAIRLYKENYAPTLIFSGAAADASGPSNAKAMARQAEADGISKDHIILEETSANTNENAIAVATIIKHMSGHSLILVTSPYHQRRASIEFSRALGPEVRIINHSAFDQNWSRSRWWLHGYNYSITLAELQKTLFILIGRVR